MPMLQLEYVTWDGSSHTYALRDGTTRIGRTPDNDLQIDDLALSAHHCRIEVDGESAVVVDEESSSGTFLDGELIEKATLCAGQLLNLGTFTLNISPSADGGGGKRPLAEKNLHQPMQLPDGSYSCQIHRADRAEFECEACFSLFCPKCLSEVVQKHSDMPSCPRCDRSAKRIDWSGLARTKQDVVMEILPDGVKKAIRYWEKYKDWEDSRGNPGAKDSR